MPYRPPLVPHEVFVADPPELPVRAPGEGGLSAVTRAELVSADATGVSLKASASDGGTLLIQLSAAGEGVLRVRLERRPAGPHPVRARRSGWSIPGSYPLDVRAADGSLRLAAGGLVAEITLDPWHVRFLDALRAAAGGAEPAARPTSAAGCARCRSGAPLAGGAVAAYHESFAAPPTSGSPGSASGSPRWTSAASGR